MDAFALVDRRSIEDINDETIAARALGVVLKEFVSGEEPTRDDPLYALLDEVQVEVAERDTTVRGMRQFIETLAKRGAPLGRKEDLRMFIRDLEALRSMGLHTIDFVGNMVMVEGRPQMFELSVEADSPKAYDVVWF